jgi:CspA family cold shock protein
VIEPSGVTPWRLGKQESTTPQGTIKKWFQDKYFGFISPADGSEDVFFHECALREGDDITEGASVTYEVGLDKKSGKTKAVSVDIA